APHRALPSFPTRRSSDLVAPLRGARQLPPPTQRLQFGRHTSLSLPQPISHVLRSTPKRAGVGAGLRKIVHDYKSNREYHVIYLRSEEHTSELQSRFDLVC